ncbi:hypothetical protein FQN54_005626 [Arachnomyces sp. PD_36]|nr:hypothetical protein FQN54_005626 [Arachnomyces sp. PD_36]
MAVPPLSLAAGAAFLLYCVYNFIIYPVFLSPLAKIPNAHPTSPISPLWMLWNRYRAKNNRTIHAAHKKHGPIVRLGPSEISVNCVDNGIRTIYIGGFEKHDWYPRQFGSHGTISMFSMVHSKPHSVRKRMLSNIYSKSYLQTSPHLDKVSQVMIGERLLPLLQKAAESSSPLDVYDLNNAFTMDFVSSYIFGLRSTPNLTQDLRRRRHFLYIYQCRREFEFWDQELPGIAPWSKRLGIPLIPKYCDDANDELEAYVLDMCDNAEKYLSTTDVRSEPVVYKQLKQSLLKQEATKGNEHGSMATTPEQRRLDIACEMLDQVTAGHETSAIALTYLYWEMSRNPSLQAELRAELETLSPPITYPNKSSFELPEPKDVEALPLLQAIVTETLRLHAPIPGIQPRVTPSPPTSLAGYDNIPPNIRVSAQAYSLHRNPDVFEDPDTFNPKRWINAEDAELEEMKRWFWAFGSGGRMCVGSNLALQGSTPDE